MKNRWFGAILGFFLIGQLGYGQCLTFESYPEGEAAAKAAYNSYKAALQNKDYKTAFMGWKQLYDAVSGETEMIYEDGVVLYKTLLKEMEDRREATQQQSEFFELFERWATCFGTTKSKISQILGRKAVAMYEANLEETLTLEAFDVALATGDWVQSPIFVETLAGFCTYLHGTGFLEKNDLWRYRVQLEKMVKFNLESTKEAALRAEYEAAWQRGSQYFDLYIPKQKNSDCEEMVMAYRQRYENTTSDSLRQLVVVMISRLHCAAAFEFLEAIRPTEKDTTGKFDFLSEIKLGDPLTNGKEDKRLVSETAQRAKVAFQANLYSEAIQLFKKAITESTNYEQKAQYAYEIAEIYAYKFNDKSMARMFALEAARQNSKWGKPFFLIGNLYEASYNECIKGRNTNPELLLIAAFDKWELAQAMDSSLKEGFEVKKRRYDGLVNFNPDCPHPIRTQITLECWVGETITVFSCE